MQLKNISSEYLGEVKLISGATMLRGAKTYLRIEHDFDDAFIEQSIDAAIELIEKHTSKVIGIKAYELHHSLDFHDEVIIPKFPLIKVLKENFVDEKNYPIREISYKAVLENDTNRIKFNKKFKGAITMHLLIGYDLQDLPNAFRIAIYNLVDKFYHSRNISSYFSQEILNLLAPYKSFII